MMSGVTAKNSETKLCIDEFLKKSEKEWFSKRHDAKLGRSALSSRASSVFGVPRVGARSVTSGSEISSDQSRRGSDAEAGLTQFALGNDFVPIKGLKKFMQLRIGGWQVYAIFLALVSHSS